ncbi:Guanosine polyphosphate pyrophosphohydrolase/synthetase [Rhodanobacter denitrificans]|nr:Guanosine polyphosphate pyrophosphohydrolase/synthetase [Rhodanobacter denitrificans]
MTALTDRFSRAVDYARIAHATQCRKGSNIPYLYHLLGVASLVIEFGGNEDQVIAGLLHDTIEDGGAEHEATIRAQFGDAVANIVKDCTDGTAEGKASHTDAEAKRRDWIERKLAYPRAAGRQQQQGAIRQLARPQARADARHHGCAGSTLQHEHPGTWLRTRT